MPGVPPGCPIVASAFFVVAGCNPQSVVVWSVTLIMVDLYDKGVGISEVFRSVIDFHDRHSSRELES